MGEKTLKQVEDREYHRNKVIKEAVGKADRVILDGSDGSVEETNFITAEVAKAFMNKAMIPFNSAMTKKDLGL